ncbi:bifunctional metallophosphatase/5'-nucleotidase [Paenibacillus thailandensis]|uniref:Bifunctional metallophosphatase/5'-nucleotidase n=1 Tax=Paenibacillus thailandensis TaxID=393250 RepID=A0ABW5QRI5_9BACL
MEDARHVPAKLIIIHSNDIHSRLENAARIASFIAEERNKHGAEHVLALDIGDHIDRMRPETEGSDGAVNVELLNEAGYDAVTLGNNEGLTYTPDIIGNVYRERAKFPVVCANLHRLPGDASPDWLLPNVVIRRGGLNVGLIGVTANFHDFYTLIGWKSGDPLTAVAEQVGRLRANVDIIAVMSHVGLNFDRKLAETVPGIDLIMGGHTHHLLEEPLVIGGTTICAAGKHGEYAGRVEISVDEAGRPVMRASCVASEGWAESPKAADLIERFRRSASIRLSRVVARLEEPLQASTEGESPLGNLLAAGLRRWTGTKIGLVNTGQLLEGLPAGDVTEGMLHALCPSPINPCKLLLKGSDLLEALEESLRPEYTEKAIKGFGFRGRVLGSLAVDGMEVVYGGKDGGIVSVTVGGEPLESEKLYEVGTIDMFTFKIGYESLARSEQIIYYLPEFIRHVLAEELQDKQALGDCRRKRWVKQA